jgi:predicted Zn-dependent protease
LIETHAAGGTVVVFEGLFGIVKNEDELAFVLAHEIGEKHAFDQSIIAASSVK